MENQETFYKTRFFHWLYAVDSLDDVLLLVNRSRRVLRSNQALQKWGLFSVREVNGMDLHTALHQDCDDPSCYIENLWYRMSRGFGYASRLESEVKDELLKRWVHISIEPLRRATAEEDAPFALIVVRDRTKLYRERELEDRKTRFEALHFVQRGLAHEVGNPLAAMRTSVEVLTENLDRFPREKVLGYLERILEGTERLQSIVDRTLQNRAATILEMKILDLSTILSRMQRLYEDEVDAKGLRFQIQFPEPGAIVSFWGDLTAVEEVLMNIIKNSLEATAAGGFISIRHRADSDFVWLNITDDGKGMDEDQQKSLFLPFFTTKQRGIGVGLTYSNYLMTRMNGSIQVESKLNQGTTIQLRFKLRPPHE